MCYILYQNGAPCDIDSDQLPACSCSCGEPTSVNCAPMKSSKSCHSAAPVAHSGSALFPPLSATPQGAGGAGKPAACTRLQWETAKALSDAGVGT